MLRRVSHGPFQPSPLGKALDCPEDPDFTPNSGFQPPRRQRSQRIRRPLDPDENTWGGRGEGNARLLALADEAGVTKSSGGVPDDQGGACGASDVSVRVAYSQEGHTGVEHGAEGYEDAVGGASGGEWEDPGRGRWANDAGEMQRDRQGNGDAMRGSQTQCYVSLFKPLEVGHSKPLLTSAAYSSGVHPSSSWVIARTVPN